MKQEKCTYIESKPFAHTDDMDASVIKYEYLNRFYQVFLFQSVEIDWFDEQKACNRNIAK